MKIYSDDELQLALQTLVGWTIVNEAIEKIFQFKDFKQALAFIVQVGILAEQADHHPEIWNVYNKVILRLNTHSAKAITDKDTQLAEKINGLGLKGCILYCRTIKSLILSFSMYKLCYILTT